MLSFLCILGVTSSIWNWGSFCRRTSWDEKLEKIPVTARDRPCKVNVKFLILDWKFHCRNVLLASRMLIIFSFITTCYKSSDIYQIIFDTPFRLHLDNINKLEKETSEENKIGKSHKPTTVVKFGFPCTTCCGYIGQDNEWHDDWVVSVTSNVQCLVTLLQSYYWHYLEMSF